MDICIRIEFDFSPICNNGSDDRVKQGRLVREKSIQRRLRSAGAARNGVDCGAAVTVLEELLFRRFENRGFAQRPVFLR